MKLGLLRNVIKDIEIVKDGDFEALDFVDSCISDKRILTFIEKETYIKALSDNVSCLICTEELAHKVPKEHGIIVSKQPRIDFFIIHNYLSDNVKCYSKEKFPSKIGENCNISDMAVISKENVVIGNNVTIEEFVIIRDNVFIGDNCIIRAGCKIGGEGFQFNKGKENFFIKHCGGTIIKNNVEIQYNTCLDKAVFPWDNTIIDSFTKIDNLVYIAHSAKIGKRCLIAASATIGGSTVIGDNSWIGLNATISNGLTIGNNASIKLGAVVTKNMEDNQSVSGNFAIEHSKLIKFIKSIS